MISDPRIVRFGAFELSLSTGELRRNGIKVKLQDQPFRLLAFLVARPGQVVSREELREQLWPTDFVDFDHSLNTAIRKLRAALDDAAENPRFVETLARRGYRFIAPVTVSDGTASPSLPVGEADPAASRTTHTQPSPRRFPLGPVLAATLLIAVASLGAFFVMRSRDTEAGRGISTVPRPEVGAIAVLPFINEDPATAHLSDGLSEIVIDTLSRVPDLRVMGRTTVFRFKGQAFDPRRIGRELNVAAIIIGTVRSQGDQQSVHVELIDTTDGSRIWGEQYETKDSTLLAVQGRISDDLAARLRRGLDRSRSGALRFSKNPQSYELYLKGLQAWNRRTPQHLHQAVTFFKRAIELDPEFAAAYAALSQTYGVMTGYQMMPSSEGAALVMATARKALELDPDNSDAYVSIATTKFRNLWDFPGAEEDYRRALALNPSNATGHQWYADYLRAMGRFGDARSAQDRSRELDPLSRVLNHAYCGSFLAERRYEEAIAVARRSEILGRFPNGDRCLMSTLTVLGDYEGVLAELNASEVPRPEVEALESAYRTRGAEGFLRERMKIIKQRGSGMDTTLDIASFHAILGENDAAFATLEDGYRHRISPIIAFHYTPLLDPLRDDPRFEDLARRIGLPPEALAAADELRRKRPFVTSVVVTAGGGGK